MDKLEEFKEFIKDKPFLREKVDRKETTWQSLYETYDLFGKNADIFKENNMNFNQENNENRNVKAFRKLHKYICRFSYLGYTSRCSRNAITVHCLNGVNNNHLRLMSSNSFFYGL